MLQVHILHQWQPLTGVSTLAEFLMVAIMTLILLSTMLSFFLVMELMPLMEIIGSSRTLGVQDGEPTRLNKKNLIIKKLFYLLDQGFNCRRLMTPIVTLQSQGWNVRQKFFFFVDK